METTSLLGPILSGTAPVGLAGTFAPSAESDPDDAAVSFGSWLAQFAGLAAPMARPDVTTAVGLSANSTATPAGAGDSGGTWSEPGRAPRSKPAEPATSGARAERTEEARARAANRDRERVAAASRQAASKAESRNDAAAGAEAERNAAATQETGSSKVSTDAGKSAAASGAKENAASGQPAPRTPAAAPTAISGTADVRLATAAPAPLSGVPLQDAASLAFALIDRTRSAGAASNPVTPRAADIDDTDGSQVRAAAASDRFEPRRARTLRDEHQQRPATMAANANSREDDHLQPRATVEAAPTGRSEHPSSDGAAESAADSSRRQQPTTPRNSQSTVRAAASGTETASSGRVAEAHTPALQARAGEITFSAGGARDGAPTEPSPGSVAPRPGPTEAAAAAAATSGKQDSGTGAVPGQQVGATSNAQAPAPADPAVPAGSPVLATVAEKAAQAAPAAGSPPTAANGAGVSGIAAGRGLTNATAKPAPASAADTAPLERSFLDQIVRNVKIQHRQGSDTMVVHLKPPSLGKLTIKLVSESGTIVAKIDAESASTRALLEKTLPRLLQALEQSGVRIERLQVAGEQTAAGDPSGTGTADDGASSRHHRTPPSDDGGEHQRRHGSRQAGDDDSDEPGASPVASAAGSARGPVLVDLISDDTYRASINTTA
ncbi:MAG: flagellar hook-length control protein FliK [Candidatus Schekmanbacteria bacterium]|nr:flagellar hook-length control protein FliK [Candidatus Schekmanbacteria bacterium]